MSVSAEIARISEAKAVLVEKMTAAGYDVSENDQIQDIVAVLDLGGGATEPGVYPGGSVANEMDRISSAKSVLVSKMLAAGYQVSGDMLLGELAELVNVSNGTVVGVCWDYSNDSTALQRLTAANDPNGYVNTDITTEPVAAVGTGEGSSPFDHILPWSGMYECNLAGKTVTYRKGQTGFRRTNNTFVWIPEYYVKIIVDQDNSKIFFYCSSAPVNGFVKMLGSGKFVGRYWAFGDSSYESVSGASPALGIDVSTFRTKSKIYSSWRMNDYATWCAYSYLYLVEFADWNSAAKIGEGLSHSSTSSNTGGTDEMVYHTGRAAGTDGWTAVQYLGIENPYGFKYEMLDGLNISLREAYICQDPAKYGNTITEDYVSTGVTFPSSGWIKQISPSEVIPWAFFLPSVVGGTQETYIPDYFSSSRTDSSAVYTLTCGQPQVNMSGMFSLNALLVGNTITNGSGSRLIADS